MKGFYTFKQSAHTPMFEEPEKAREILRAHVLTASKGWRIRSSRLRP